MIVARSKPKRGRPPAPVKRTPQVNVRGVPAWKEWLDGFAEHCGLSLPDTIGQALAAYAAQRGYRPPPKR